MNWFDQRKWTMLQKFVNERQIVMIILYLYQFYQSICVSIYLLFWLQFCTNQIFYKKFQMLNNVLCKRNVLLIEFLTLQTLQTQFASNSTQLNDKMMQEIKESSY